MARRRGPTLDPTSQRTKIAESRGAKKPAQIQSAKYKSNIEFSAWQNFRKTIFFISQREMTEGLA
jgi:hypothetical protein